MPKYDVVYGLNKPMVMTVEAKNKDEAREVFEQLLKNKKSINITVYPNILGNFDITIKKVEKI